MTPMPTYKIPLTWEVYGSVTITAPSEEAAIEYALGPECPLPEGDYVDDSIRVDGLVDVEIMEE